MHYFTQNNRLYCFFGTIVCCLRCYHDGLLRLMTLEQLRIFVAVAEREHVTRAAEFLNLSQSAASSAISLLEQQFGLKLFHRVGRGIALTEAGKFLAGGGAGSFLRAQDRLKMRSASFLAWRADGSPFMPAKPSPATFCRRDLSISMRCIPALSSSLSRAIPLKWRTP